MNAGNDIEVLMQNGEFRQAADCIAEMLESDPHNSELHEQLSIASDHLGRHKTAYQHALKALELSPTTRRHIFAAYTAFMAGHEDDGWSRFNALHEQGVDASTELVKIGRFLFARSLTTQARFLFEQAHLHNQNASDALTWLGHCHCVLGQFDHAIACYDQSRELLSQENPTLESSRNFAYVASYLQGKNNRLNTINR